MPDPKSTCAMSRGCLDMNNVCFHQGSLAGGLTIPSTLKQPGLFTTCCGWTKSGTTQNTLEG